MDKQVGQTHGCYQWVVRQKMQGEDGGIPFVCRSFDSLVPDRITLRVPPPRDPSEAFPRLYSDQASQDLVIPGLLNGTLLPQSIAAR